MGAITKPILIFFFLLSLLPLKAQLEHKKVKIFFPHPSKLRLLSDERDILVTKDNVHMIRQTLKHLLTPPPTMSSPLWADAAFLDIFILEKNQRVIVNMNRPDSQFGGTYQEMIAIYAIVHSILRNFPHLKSVHFLIDGNEKLTLAGHMDLKRNYKLSSFMESN